MTQILFSGTVLMLAALTLVELQPAGAHAWRRRVLLGAFLTVLSLPVLVGRVEAYHWSITYSAALPVTWSKEIPPGSHVLPNALVTLWLAGMGISLARLIWQWRQAQLFFRRSGELSLDESDLVRKALGPQLSRVAGRIRTSSDIPGPCVIPTSSGARILLPSAAFVWDTAAFANVLRHEWEHVRRGDAWWRLLAGVVRALWWFHPLAHSLVRRWTEQCEHVCDDAVLRDGASPAGYARCLLKLATETALPLPLTFAASSKSRLRRRVESVLQADPQGATRGVVLGWLALVLLVAAAGIATISRVSNTPADAHQDAVQAEAKTRLEANPFPGNGP